jgi:SAM-dependent methyltransferase
MEHAQYGRLLTEAYDLDKPHPPPAELAHYRSHIAQRGEPVLEVMCGSGRLLLPLLAAGVAVDGHDASPDMLAACRHKAAARGLRPRLYEQPVQRLDLPRRYAFAFCAAGSFGLVVGDADVMAGLRRLYAHLLPGGWLLLDVEPPSARSSDSGGVWHGGAWRRPDGATITLRAVDRYDPATRVERGVGIYELFAGGRLVETEVDDWVRRFWTEDEIAMVLRTAGFAEVHAVPPYEPGPVICMLARRPPEPGTAR